MQSRNGIQLYSASDICGFLECQHLTALDLQHLVTPMKKAPASDQNRLIQDKGLAHEAAYLERLKRQNFHVVDIAEGNPSFERRVELTIEAMKAGADIIFQASLQEGAFIGHADFLRKVPRASMLGDHSYEVIDTKLAKIAKAKFLVQVALYSQMLIAIQGVQPQFMYVVLGDAERTEQAFRVADYADYLQQVLQRFAAFVSSHGQPATYPEPCGHCGFCVWRDRCDVQRHQDDHLSAVAGISRSQIKKLQAGGVTTLHQLAASTDDLRIPKLQLESLGRLRHQARLQFQGRTSDSPLFELLPIVGDRRGFSRMPTAVEGDLFFDMEGNPLEEGGLEYLFGLYIDEGGQQTFKPFWAHSREEEKIAFEQFIDWVIAHLKRYPNAHVYHYASYEETAIKRLMSQHGTREAQVDWLLRNGKLIDLYKVVREAIRVSEPSYSIKNIEHFYMQQRDGDVTSAGASIVFYERWKETGELTLLEQIERYNEDDVLSTYLLRNWLLSIKPSDAGTLAEPDAESEKAVTEQQAIEVRLESYRVRLLAGLPTDERVLSEAEQVRLLTFQLLDFHRRADKPTWWQLFSRQDMTTEELLEDIESLAGLRRTSTPPEPIDRSFLFEYSFEPQESKMRAGSQGVIAKSLASVQLVNVDPGACLATFKATANKAPPDDFDMIPGTPIPSTSLRAALFRYADSVLAGERRFHAVTDFLHRRAPRVKGVEPGASLLDPRLPMTEAIKQVVHNLEDSVLFIQGPPGAGKTYTGSHIIVDLIKAGKRIGVTSNSHHAINNLLAAVESRAQTEGVTFKGLKKSSSGEGTEFIGRCIHSIEDTKGFRAAWGGEIALTAGTAWLFADAMFTEQLDYLFVDEAGQVSMANLVTMGLAARNIVLMGDQMQLSQPIQGTHPGRSGDSILDYLLDGSPTIAPDRGVFLAQTWRMHPQVCSFISHAVYEGQLSSAPGTERQVLLLDGQRPDIPDSGLMFCSVEHDGNGQSSDEEAAYVRALYTYFLHQRYVDNNGEEHAVALENILVVAPYNLQVQLLKQVLPAGARVGTVDKFQGQEAEIVIVSMATSNEDYLPRDIGFLYSKNRLNVAVSRAKSLACIVASPELMAIRCQTPEDMSLVNGLCMAVRYGAAGETVAQCV
ncbi:TM0106 family RecB-like putative nuclease [Pseudomonas alkylphenolica]|uniref:TM0106 family RecB-like putative nuclease n=1 Tax=Pseudomonas alkylphenolica TaxID=237609 RepID=UPI0018D9F3EA|nr:TM0106 family RecB-like putative nuclease [Pseudomonas alkylphenolica]MBH3430225.1 TM0106 family RecB-like putative nuclease [Pseudomonas alkylphenolica]